MIEQTADAILQRLKAHGPQTAQALAKHLAMTAEGVRQHLAKLADQGLVNHRDEALGVGRPKRSWRLTERGHGRFPDGHSQLLADMVAAVRSEFGEPGLDKLISAREKQMIKSYGERLKSVKGLGARVRALAALRTDEGYMAEVRAIGKDGGKGGFLLLENHCPICVAATACQGFCRSELAVFRQALGPDVCVEREEHLLAGARRCAYRITRLE